MKTTIKIPQLNIEVETKLRKPMTYLEAEKLCKNGWRMLNILEAGYIHDNELIKDFAKETEWIQHFSKKMRKKGYGYYIYLWFSGLDVSRSSLGGDDSWLVSDYGVRGVRLCRDLPIINGFVLNTDDPKKIEEFRRKYENK